MRYLLVLAGLFFGITGFGQIQQVKVGINGLTCSQCSRSVEMQLRKLTFVKDVEMNLQQTEGIITLIDGKAAVPFQEIAGAVKDAGFSIRFLTITFTPGTTDPIRDKELRVNANRFFLLIIPGLPEKGNTFQFVGKSFMPPAIFKKYQGYLPKDNAINPPYFLIPSSY